MPFTKTWVGTTGDYSLDSNWLPISLRNSTYRWIASGSGTNEYYCELSGGGNPSLEQPTNVQIDGTNATSGSPGTLAAGRWGWGDNDTLGFNTVYVRLSDGADPDSKERDYVTFTKATVATNNVRIPAGSGSIDGGDFSSIAIADFIVEPGHTGLIGSDTDPLIIDPDTFIFSGGGLSYIDIYTANISPQIFETSSAADGTFGLYLTGSNMATVNVMGGSVGLAALSGQTSTAASVRVTGNSSNVFCGKGLTLTTAIVEAGDAEFHCAGTTLTNNGGTVTTRETGAWTTMNANAGTIYPESSGTVTTINLNGGTVNAYRSTVTRTFTNVKRNRGSFSYDPACVTVTNWTTPDYPIRDVVNAPTA